MTVTYAGHPRGYRPEAPEAVHWTGGTEAWMARKTSCKRGTEGRLVTDVPERTTCRECRGAVEAA